MEYTEYKEVIEFLDKIKETKKKTCLTCKRCEDCILNTDAYQCAANNLENLSENDFKTIKEHYKWEKVPIDTKVLVWDREFPDIKLNAHFAEYKNGKIYTWAHGKTSFTSFEKEEWNFGELYNEN